jgi:hypothetical protein
MRLRRSVVSAVLLAAAAAGAVSGCGSSSPKLAPAAKAADFPTAASTNFVKLEHLPAGPIMAPSVSVMRVGANRYGFALFTPDHKQVTDAEVALYTVDTHGQHLAGPYPAHLESLDVSPQYESQTVAQDPTAAHSVFVAEVPFAHAGKQNVLAVERVAGQLQWGSGTGADPGQPGGPPDAGQAAISVHTPTVSQVGLANVGTIDTRQPPAPDLQQVDFASVLGKKPVVLLFATPQLCSSRVCGPVTDIEEQVKSQIGSRVAFIHMEIYNDNEPSMGVRPQVRAFHLPSVPWLFTINREGRVSSAVEGAFGSELLDKDVEKAVSE